MPGTMRINDLPDAERTGAAPVTSRERIGELDVLRGFALLGVLIANLTGFAGSDMLATSDQLEALPSASNDAFADLLVTWLVHDKANTLFAFLFGVGFWVMCERMRARGIAFERIYLRRLTILLIFGMAHFLLIFNWDILHLYALAGFALLALRKASDRMLLAIGLPLLVFGRAFFDWLFDWAGISGPAFEIAYSTEAILARSEASYDYLDLTAAMIELSWYDWILSGWIVGWFAYVLGRFLIGAYVARQGWLTRASELLPHYRKWLAILLPIGLAGELLVALVWLEFVSLGPTGDTLVGDWLHYATVPILAAAYVCLLVLAFNAVRWRRLAIVFAPVGRMALTNYVMQSLFIGFLLYGMGLGLAGKVGTAWLLAAAIGFYALQALASQLWLRGFGYGPLEWCWRVLTYGKRVPLRRALAN